MKCKRCKVEKPTNESGRCDHCDEYVANYYKKNRDREIARAMKSSNKKTREEINKYKKGLNRKNPVSIILQQARRRAKLKSIPFNISIDDIDAPDICPVLGMKLVVNKGHVKEDSMTIDRLIPDLGYVKGNVSIISHKANTIKNNATIEELEKVLHWLRKKIMGQVNFKMMKVFDCQDMPGNVKESFFNCCKGARNGSYVSWEYLDEELYNDEDENEYLIDRKKVDNWLRNNGLGEDSEIVLINHWW